MERIVAAIIPDLDIYRLAKLLIDQHGGDAPIFAAMQADKRSEARGAGGVAEGAEGGQGDAADPARAR